MATLNLDLLFLDDVGPDGPMALIQVKSSGVLNVAANSHEGLISPNCLSPRELDAQIDRLHVELEEIRVKGRKMFVRVVRKG